MNDHPIPPKEGDYPNCRLPVPLHFPIRVSLSIHCPSPLCRWEGEAEIDHGEDFAEACPSCGAGLLALHRSPLEIRDDARAHQIMMTLDEDMAESIYAVAALPVFAKQTVLIFNVRSYYASRDDELLATAAGRLVQVAYLGLHAN